MWSGGKGLAGGPGGIHMLTGEAAVSGHSGGAASTLGESAQSQSGASAAGGLQSDPGSRGDCQDVLGRIVALYVCVCVFHPTSI